MPSDAMPRTPSAQHHLRGKQQHVDSFSQRDVAFRGERPPDWTTVNSCTTPSPNSTSTDIDTVDPFLGRPLAPSPVGFLHDRRATPDALAINRRLAEVCAEVRLALGVGSQRQALEDAAVSPHLLVVREVAPDIPGLGNIGAAEVARH